MLSPTIRPNATTDAEAVRALIRGVASEGQWLVTDTYVPIQQWENVLREPANFPDQLLLVAEAGEEIVGWCRVFPVFGIKSSHVTDLGIGVAKNWRDIGIGTALIARAIEWAQGKEFEKITLSVFSSNQRALHVLEKQALNKLEHVTSSLRSKVSTWMKS